MDYEERNRITSNDYADLLVDYRSDSYRVTNIADSTTNIIDSQYLVVHIPVENMTPNSIYKFGYSAIPACYGLLTELDSEAPQINKFNVETNLEESGQGILVGFIDTGIDYTNEVFKNTNNTTRIISIWDQTIESMNGYPEGFYYGTEFSQEQINQALQTNNPLSIVPSIDDVGHGTKLAGIAAGFQEVEDGYVGVAPETELVIVKLKTAKPYLKDFYSIPQEAICYQENDIMFAMRYLAEVSISLRRPIAICIGLGTSQGDHAGRGMLSRYITKVGITPGVAVVVAAGNEGNRGHHYFGEIKTTGGYNDVELNVGTNDQGFSMELWGTAPTEFAVEIFAPTGEYLSRIPIRIGLRETIDIYYEGTRILVDNQMRELDIGNQLVIFRFQNPMAGVWIFRVAGQGDLPFAFHIWLPIVNFMTRGTHFLRPNQNTTITSPGMTQDIITVTAFNHFNQNLYYYASRGYTVLNEVKPDIAAPGVSINCPTIGNKLVRCTGSSFAAAYTTGVAALFLEIGVKKNLATINSMQIKRILTWGAKRNPELIYPNPEWGYGVLDVVTSYNYIINLL